MYIPFKPPPGIYRNGTRGQAEGRWYDSTGVRWHHGTLRPIQGAEPFKNPDTGQPISAIPDDPISERVRDIFVFRDNGGIQHYLFGSNTSLYHMTAEGVVTNITPAGLPPNNSIPGASDGYGAGLYGEEAYGTPRSEVVLTTTRVGRWKFQAWGEDVIILPDWDGSLYLFDVSTLATPTAIPNAPTDFTDFIVTDQRIVLGIGSLSDARRVRTSNREDYTVWTPDETNYCMDRVLSGTGKLVSVSNVAGQALILSETDVQSGTFLGVPFVYGFETVGHNCAPRSRHSVQNLNNFAVWLGDENFWFYDGTVKPLPCEVIDYIKENAAPGGGGDLIVTWYNTQFTELWWHYQSNDSSDIDSYVYWSWEDNHWGIGSTNRIGAYDSGILADPIQVAPDGIAYNHELQGTVTDISYATSGPLKPMANYGISELTRMFCETLAPGDVAVTVFGRPSSMEPALEFGPYNGDSIVPVSAYGRELQITFLGNGGIWELGPVELDFVVQEASGRR